MRSARSRADGLAPARAAFAAARAERAAELDRWLGSLLTSGSGEVALIAVGSHARRELTPGGDLDLVLLHRGRSGIAEVADRVWYPVWDSGLRLDHSVRTVDEARTVARGDLKAALGLLSARWIAGDRTLADDLRAAVLTDWRADAPGRLAALSQLCRERWEAQGELAFLLEPDLKEARGGLRDVHILHAVVASWVAPGPDGRVRAAHDLLLDVRHALHEVTGRASDRLVLQEQEAVARALGLADANVLQRSISEAARTITYATSHAWRRAKSSGAARRGHIERRPVGNGAVEHDGEVVLARNADLNDPALVLRVAAAAAHTGIPLAPATVDRLADSAALLPTPWPATARDALVSLLGAGPAAIGVWEALDQAGLIVRLLPEWERVRNRSQRNPVHRFTVDRHLVETAAGAAALTRDVARPDLLLLGALLHDIGKGRPGDHSTTGAALTHDIGTRLGLPADDVRVLETLVRHHLLLPETATRRDIDDPMTVQTVTTAVSAVPGREREILDLLAALAIADGNATGPAAWGPWKAALVADLTRRAAAALSGGSRPVPALPPEHVALARHDGAAVRVTGSRITIAAPDRPGLLWRAAGVLALHRLAVKTARTTSSPTPRAPLPQSTTAAQPNTLAPHPSPTPSSRPLNAPTEFLHSSPTKATTPTAALAPASSDVSAESEAPAGATPSELMDAAASPPDSTERTRNPSGERAASASAVGSAGESHVTAVLDFTAVPEYGTPPDPAALEADLRRMLADRLDVADRLERRARSMRVRPGVAVAPPRVMIVDDASRTATVVEVRAHDRPGLLWRIGQALGACGLQVRAAQVDTLGAEAVDVFYVVDAEGHPLDDPAALATVRSQVLAALR
ncbi:[protein-PII] uridylyltransferase [Actinomadura sp. 3N508]|uniref:[protein-PII] uridylyltransferase n=1 Tax=Actinomadura sp. 3N508 TaxID=3375153 RepID=UPI0037B696BC